MTNNTSSTNVINISLHDGQKELIYSQKRITAVTAGQGGGKTTGGYWRIYGMMRVYPGEAHFVGFPTYQLLNRVVLNPVDPDRPTLVEFLTTMGENPKLHKVDRWIECKSGNILFASAENLAQWEGSHVKSAWVDEFDECPVGAFKRAMERTRMKQGYVLLTGTPRYVKWIKSELITNQAQAAMTNMIRFPSTANPAYDPIAMEEARLTLPTWEYRRLYLGELAEAEGGNLFHRNWWMRSEFTFEGGNWVAEISM